MKIKQELGDKSGVSISLGQLGTIHKLEKDYLSAITLWRIAYSTFEEMKSPNKDIVARWILALKDELGEEKFDKLMQRATEQLSQEESKSN